LFCQKPAFQVQIVASQDSPFYHVPNGGHADYSEATLPGHLHGEDEGDAGSHAGDVLDGDAPIAAALVELKKMLAPLGMVMGCFPTRLIVNPF